MQVSEFFVRKRKSVALDRIEEEGGHVLRSRKSCCIDPVSLPAQSEDVNLSFSCLFYYQFMRKWSWGTTGHLLLQLNVITVS